MSADPSGRWTGGQAEPSDPPQDLDRQRAAYVDYSILTLVIEHVEASLHEAPTLSTVELLERLRDAATRQLAEYESLRELGSTAERLRAGLASPE